MSSPPHSDYFHEQDELLAVAEVAIRERFPEVLGQNGYVDWAKAPQLSVRCPKRHRLFTLQLDDNHNGVLHLNVTSPAHDSAFLSADPLDNIGEVVDATRTRHRIRCPACRYDGTWRAERLLRFYVVNALQLGVRSACLPT